MLRTTAPPRRARFGACAMGVAMCWALTAASLSGFDPPVGRTVAAAPLDEDRAFSGAGQAPGPPGMFERYRYEAVAVLGLITVQTGLIVGLLVQRRRRRAAELAARRLAGLLLTAQEAERTRIARDLHDGVCQQVASLAVDLSCLRQRGVRADDTATTHALGSLQQRAAAIAEDIRLLSHTLHPSVLQHIGLVEALRGQCAEVERQHGLKIRFHVDGDVEPASPGTSLALFRIAQEALRNSARHSQAAHATVSLVRSRRRLTMTLSDDGRGFDSATVRARGCLGLVSIEERTRLLAGHVVIRSSPGRGTTIEARVPIDLPDPRPVAGHRDARWPASSEAIP